VAVPDAYRWLEETDSAEVAAWTAAQGRFARLALDALPGRDAIRERLAALFSIGTVSPPTVRGGRYFYQRREGTQEQPVLYVRNGSAGVDRVLLDPAALSPDATSALDWHYPSPDGRLVAYGISEGGSEKSTLRVREVGTGRDRPDVIPWTRACSLEWRPDGSGFFYTRYPEPGRVPPGEEEYHRHVFEHRLGEDWRRDVLLFGEGREPEDWPSIHLSPDGRFLAVSVSRGWTRTDVYLNDRTRGGGFVPVVEGIDSLFGVTLRNDRLYLHTNHGAPRYRLVTADPERPGSESWQDVIPEGPEVLEGALLVGQWILVHRLRDASSRLALYDLRGRPLRELDLPGIGTVGAMTGEWDGKEAFFGFSSFTTPPAVYRVAVPEGPAEPWQAVEGDVNPRAYAVQLVRYASKDGTPVSMFLVHGRDRPPGGPALLTGYGGFNVSLTPAFGRSLMLFLERGGLYAVAHLRGGGEYGEEWHRAGMREHKQNVFDDFLAAAEFLLREGHVARGRLAIMGGSNGGLLVGAALTQRPELFAAAVCQVPLLDMLRYQRFRIARLWIAEYGSPEDPDAFRWLHAYSPYHSVKDGTPYPAVLLTAGEADSRVDPMHARKMAARLQAATSSGRPILLRLETRAGHGQGKPVSKLVAEWTDVWSFLLAELGMSSLGQG
jgi:prolyl oligopeptidase